jgi:hypothetical protein
VGVVRVVVPIDHPALMPRNRRLDVPGVVQAYAEKSVTAGDDVHFRVHCPDHKYRLSVVRLGWDVAAPTRDWVLHEFDVHDSVSQEIRPGSYVSIADGVTEQSLPALTLEAWVRPFAAQDAYATLGVITQYSRNPDHCGFGLFLATNGVPGYYFGDGAGFVPNWLRGGSALTLHEWHHLVAMFFPGGQARLNVDGVEDAAAAYQYPHAAVHPGSEPLRLGACGEGGEVDHFLEGDLAMPVVYNDVLAGDYITQRFQTTPPTVPGLNSVIGCWPLSEETGPVSEWRRRGGMLGREKGRCRGARRLVQPALPLVLRWCARGRGRLRHPGRRIHPQAGHPRLGRQQDEPVRRGEEWPPLHQALGRHLLVGLERPRRSADIEPRDRVVGSRPVHGVRAQRERHDDIEVVRHHRLGTL